MAAALEQGEMGVELDGERVTELVGRLVDVVQHLREEGLFNLEQFLSAAERQMGGTLVLQCPSRFKKRAVPEARFASEGFMGSLG